MSFNKASALEAILVAIEELNQTRNADKQIPAHAGTILFGPDSMMESLDLVNLVMAAEQNLYDAWGVEVLLASEAAMSRRHSPFRSPETLADYAVEVATAA